MSASGSRPLRLVAAGAVVIILLAVVAPAAATQCPARIRRVYDAAATRFVERAYDARDKAAEAARLHGEGRHEDAEKIATEGLKLLGIDRPAHSTR